MLVGQWVRCFIIRIIIKTLIEIRYRDLKPLHMNCVWCKSISKSTYINAIRGIFTVLRNNFDFSITGSLIVFVTKDNSSRRSCPNQPQMAPLYDREWPAVRIQTPRFQVHTCTWIYTSIKNYMFRYEIKYMYFCTLSTLSTIVDTYLFKMNSAKILVHAFPPEIYCVSKRISFCG